MAVSDEHCRACGKAAKERFRLRLRAIDGQESDWSAPWCGTFDCYRAIRREVLDACKVQG